LAADAQTLVNEGVLVKIRTWASDQESIGHEQVGIEIGTQHQVRDVEPGEVIVERDLD